MLSNDNEFDQIFRERLRDHSSPVRADVWRRVLAGMGDRRHHRMPFWPYLAAIGVVGITLLLVVPRLHHSAHPSPRTSRPPSANAVNHYSQIPPSDLPKAAIGSAGQAESATSPYPAANHNGAAARGSSYSPTALGLSAGTQSTAARSGTSISAGPGSDASLPSTHFKALANPRPFIAVTLPGLATVARVREGIVPPAIHGPKPDRGNPNAGIRFFDRFYLSLFGSVDFPSPDYRFAYTGGVRLTYQISKHWSATTGLQYSAVNVRHNDYDSLVLKVGYFDIDMPVLIGYTFLQEKWTFTINGGVMINLNSGKRGGFGLSHRPKRSGPYLGFDYAHRLSSEWSVFAEPYLQYFNITNSFILPPHTLSGGLQVGLRYHL